MAIYLGTTGGASGGAHIPSSTEFANLKSIMDGLSLTTGDDYRVKLHMPLAGIRNYSSDIRYQGLHGRYWSSSPYGSSYPERARYLYFDSSDVDANTNYTRANAFPLRCFKDVYVEPDNTWTVVAGTLGGAGIFHNATLGVISVTNGSDKNITMKDKNEGATVVYNDGDTLSENNCGKYYQRGNYYGFAWTGTLSKTSTTRVSTAGYGGSNPYYSDTFITSSSSPYDWSNPSNDNLRANSSSAYFTPVELMELKELYLGGKYNEGQPLIPGDYTLLRGPCDEGFHVPLKEEFDAIMNTNPYSTKGIYYTDYLHMPKSSQRSYSSGGRETGEVGCNYWTSSPKNSGENNYESYKFYVSYSRISVNYSTGKRATGCSVRAFRNTPIIPDSSWTETVTGKVWYNSDLGLISVLVGTNQYVTLQDKNVGATEVYNGTLNANNRGKYFQRGNNYGFTWNSSGDTSTTLVDASNYGPSNTYSSSTFITTSGLPYDRSSVENDNLRGYTDFNS